MLQSGGSNEPQLPTSPQADEGLKSSQSDEFARITQMMYARNFTLAQMNKTLSMLRALDTLILDPSRNLKHLSEEVAKIFVTTASYTVAGVWSLNRYSEKVLSAQSFAHRDPSLSDSAKLNLNLVKEISISLENKWPKEQKYLVFNAKSPGLKNELKALNFDENFAELLERLQKEYDVSALYLTKLTARDNLNGVLMIGLQDETPMIDDIELIERLGEPVGIGLDNCLLYEENQRFLAQLQESNRQLIEMDHTKDEFIALVNHQLRTPLTSIKGFLSMILEGDAGPVVEEQRLMLQQAFESSQRMVYLITDLLNASRLKSGKMTIVNKKTYLPDIVEAEVNQFINTSAFRKVKLTFNKPENFPIVMLDDTKVRQVIMNFIDNALFYTPEGGHVSVELRIVEDNVVYAVIDNGLGVPAKDQDSLFTKFYRADNAKKARPEGTGLGLYMAKKVINAQGGEIIFKSVEGRGSIFGFKFPLSKIKVTEDAEPNS